MGLCLIAAVDLSLIVVILEVAAALGAVIFVHELGHFVVAKLCGVKCERFYLGFDIAGLKLCKFRYGETEYGIGILPLGGYVKMLGQEDNPARLREEIERAKKKQAEGQGAMDVTSQAEQPSPPAPLPEGEGSIDIEAAEQALYDPRSYLAKSVPQRMAIISAGVIMNVIFALITAVIAYRMGVTQVSPAIGSVVPGRPAWQMGFRPGDVVEEIGGEQIEQFNDLRKRISLGHSPEEGVPITVRRTVGEGEAKRIEKTVSPTKGGLMRTIGVGPPFTTQLAKKGLVGDPGSAALRATPPLANGDRIVKMGDEPINSYAQLISYLARHVDAPIEVTVDRDGQQLTSTVPPNPMRRLGLQMNIGPVSALEEGAPAEKAGLKVGDLILSYTAEPGAALEPVGDPMTWPARLRSLGEKPIELGVQRDGQQLRLPVTLRAVDWFEQPATLGSPMSVPQLGVAYRVLNHVGEVVPGSPADKADLKGAIIKRAVIVPPDEKDAAYADVKQSEETVEFSEKQRNWPALMYSLQGVLPGTRVKLVLEDGREATLDVIEVADWFNPDCGFRLEPDLFVQKAENWAEAVRFGAEETWESLTMVVAFIRRLSSGDVSPRGLGGPITIAKVAGQAAYQGMPDLLIFLTIIGANLAVLNFLPIPLLDGGHMVFLIYEGIRGKPADERVQLALTYVGLAFILGLMILVFGLDLGIISRQVPVE